MRDTYARLVSGADAQGGALLRPLRAACHHRSRRGEALRVLLQDGERTEYYCKRIFEHEAEADEITRQVLGAVRRTFITPFDRTDIQDLASSLDDAIDQMNKTAARKS